MIQKRFGIDWNVLRNIIDIEDYLYNKYFVTPLPTSMTTNPTTANPTALTNPPTETPTNVIITNTCPHIQGVCRDGYYDSSYEDYNWWECGKDCVGGQYYTDNGCNCVCKLCPETINTTKIGGAANFRTDDCNYPHIYVLPWIQNGMLPRQNMQLFIRNSPSINPS